MIQLDPATFKPAVITKTNSAEDFALELEVWRAFPVVVKVVFADGSEVTLIRNIAPGGARR